MPPNHVTMAAHPLWQANVVPMDAPDDGGDEEAMGFGELDLALLDASLQREGAHLGEVLPLSEVPLGTRCSGRPSP